MCCRRSFAEKIIPWMIDGKQRLLFIIEWRSVEKRMKLYQENPIIIEEEFIVAGAIIFYNCQCHKNGQTRRQPWTTHRGNVVREEASVCACFMGHVLTPCLDGNSDHYIDGEFSTLHHSHHMLHHHHHDMDYE